MHWSQDAGGGNRTHFLSPNSRLFLPYVFINLLEIPLILIDIVFAARVGYIYKMDRNLPVFPHILARAYIHTPIDLPGVRRNDFSDSLSAQAVDFPCKSDGVTSLSRSSGTENSLRSGVPGFPKSASINSYIGVRCCRL